MGDYCSLRYFLSALATFMVVLKLVREMGQKLQMPNIDYRNNLSYAIIAIT
jgi:hypothetical protein